jgi:hypothetical protein
VTVRVHPANRSKIERAFWEFHRENPGVYDELVALARDLQQRGYDRLGIGMLFEVLRWRRMKLTVASQHDFKLNNNYRAYYSRLIMQREPDLDGIFNTRELAVPHHVVPEAA